MNVLSVAGFVFREFLLQRITLLLIAALVILLLIFTFTVHIVVADGKTVSISILNGNPISGENAHLMAQLFTESLSSLGFVSVLVLCIISTAGLVPEMFARGTMVFLLTKSLPRLSILLGIFAGAVGAFAAIQVLAYGTFWVILSMKVGSFEPFFLTFILPSVVSFASVFSMMLLLSILLRSVSVIASLALFHVVVLSELLAARESIPSTGFLYSAIRQVANVLYYALPQAAGLLDSAKRIALGKAFPVQPYLFSCLSAMLLFLLSWLSFRRKDI